MADITTNTDATTSPKITPALPLNPEQETEYDTPTVPLDTGTEGGNLASEVDNSYRLEAEGNNEFGDIDFFQQAYEAYETFLQTDDIADLNSAISYGRRALKLCQSGHPDHGACLHNLGVYLSDRFDRTNDAGDLSEAIQLRRHLLNLCPPGDPDRGQRLNSLGASLSDRFDETGDLNDLSESIQLGREALNLCPTDPQDRSTSLSILGTRLKSRFSRTGDVNDLSESIQLGREALTVCPFDDPNRSWRLTALSIRLSHRFDRTSCINDISESIHLGREALNLTPFHDPNHSVRLNNLSYVLNVRSKKTGEINDLSEAIQLGREALKLSPLGHPSRRFCLDTLGVILSDRFNKTGNGNDLFESIQLGREALGLCPPGNDDRSLYLRNLSLRLFDQLNSSNDHAHQCNGPFEAGPYKTIIDRTETIEQAISMLREGTAPSPSPLADRLSSAASWREYSKKYNHKSQLEAMEETLNVFDESMGHSRSLESLHQRVSEFHTREASVVASDAAALALETEDVMLAASFLERGRSLIFTQLGRFRRFDLVQDAPPELVQRFTELSATLDDLVVHGPNARVMQTSAGEVFNDLGIMYQRTHAEWTSVVDEIRQVEGLETFLRPPSFEQLRRAAVGGPVILINLSQDRSDAIIIFSTGDPVLVPLREATPEAVHALADRFGARPAECHRDDAISVLREVWRVIVSPIVTALLDPRIRLRLGSRIWWCPTGAASRLPLHAAGPYARGERNLTNYFISSYTPTLGALIRARKARTVSLMDNKPVQEILVVGQPDTPNERHLPKVIDEVQAIKQRVPRATFLESSQGTKAAVLGGLREHKWIHLACHGHHNSQEPFQSHFALYDGPISLIDLIEKDLPHAELAVLSACHSARVSEQLPDEVLHPAAGMLFAGYKSVIGTMWALDDGIGSALADQFYRLMLGGKNGPRPYSNAAVVLAKAFNALDRAGYEIPFMQRINVVHYGV